MTASHCTGRGLPSAPWKVALLARRPICLVSVAPADLDFIGSAITFCSLGQMAGILDEAGEHTTGQGGDGEIVPKYD